MPIENFGGVNTNITYYEDVRVPVANLVGEENQGWKLITNQLNHERVTLCSSGVVERMLDDVRGWAQGPKLADGRRVIDQEWVQSTWPGCTPSSMCCASLNWKVAWLAQSGASSTRRRVVDQGVRHRVLHGGARLLMEGDGDQAPMSGDSPGAVLRGAERMLRRCTFSRSAAVPTRCSAT